MEIKVKKTAIVVGCSQMGVKLAMSLSKKGYKVVIMDHDVKAFDRVDQAFRGTEFLGDGSNMSVLRYLGVDNIYIFVAATDDDAINLKMIEMARKIYHLDRLYAELTGKNNEKKLKHCNADEKVYQAMAM